MGTALHTLTAYREGRVQDVSAALARVPPPAGGLPQVTFSRAGQGASSRCSPSSGARRTPRVLRAVLPKAGEEAAVQRGVLHHGLPRERGGCRRPNPSPDTRTRGACALRPVRCGSGGVAPQGQGRGLGSAGCGPSWGRGTSLPRLKPASHPAGPTMNDADSRRFGLASSFSRCIHHYPRIIIFDFSVVARGG